MKFALELFVPEKLMPAGGNSASDPMHEAAPDTVPSTAAPAAEPAASWQKARRMIEELDHGRFGGPSFGPQTIELMTMALESAEASLSAPVSDEQLRTIAAILLTVAGDGERDPVRLRAAAMSAIGPAGTAGERPPSSGGSAPPG